MDIESFLASKGAKGSLSRLEAIADLDLGERSIAAKRVLIRRRRRMYLLALGFSSSIVDNLIKLENLDHETDKG